MKLFYVLLLSVLIVAEASAQDTAKDKLHPYIIELNNNGAILKSYKVKWNSIVNLKIKGINPLRLISEAKTSSVNLDFKMPENLGVDAGGVGNDIKTEKEAKTKKDKSEIAHRESDSTFQVGMKRVNFYSLQIKDLSPNQKLKVDSLNYIIDSLSSQLIVLKKYNDSILAVIILLNEIDQNKQKFTVAYNKSLALLSKIYRYTAASKYLDSIGAITFINDVKVFRTNLKKYMQQNLGNNDFEISALSDSLHSAITIFSHQFSEATKYYEILNKRIDTVAFNFTGDLVDSATKFTLKISKAKAMLNQKKLFEAQYNQLVEYNKKIADPQYSALLSRTVSDAVVLYNQLYNTEMESEIGMKEAVNPITDDVVTVTPVIKNIKGDVLRELPSFKIYTYGKWKVNVSGGYFLSLIKEDNYTNYTDTTGKSIGIKKANSNAMSHTAGLLIHAYKTTKSNFAVAGSAGFSLPIANQGLNFYFGGSLLFNENDKRFVLSAGIAFTQVQKLNTSNLTGAVGDTYTYNSNNRQAVYDKVYKPAPFLSLTYNLSNLGK